jgi:hypothetical protein
VKLLAAELMPMHRHARACTEQGASGQRRSASSVLTGRQLGGDGGAEAEVHAAGLFSAQGAAVVVLLALGGAVGLADLPGGGLGLVLRLGRQRAGAASAYLCSLDVGTLEDDCMVGEVGTEAACSRLAPCLQLRRHAARWGGMGSSVLNFAAVTHRAAAWRRRRGGSRGPRRWPCQCTGSSGRHSSCTGRDRRTRRRPRGWAGASCQP